MPGCGNNIKAEGTIMAKGSDYEREIAKALSMWWTEDEHDAVFWRSSNSGGRATVRSQKGKKTQGQEGDLTATDPIGKPLTDLCLIELKRGYKGASVYDLLDYTESRKGKQVWTGFFQQINRAQVHSGCPYFMLITRRDAHTSIITIPFTLFVHLRSYGLHPSSHIRSKVEVDNAEMDVISMRLENFFSFCDPNWIRENKHELHGILHKKWSEDMVDVNVRIREAKYGITIHTPSCPYIGQRQP